MKKIFLLATVLLFSVMSAVSQDTIHSRSLKGTYFTNHWATDTFTSAHPSCEWFSSESSLVLKHFYSKDSIRIYGIAVSMYDQHMEIFQQTPAFDDLVYDPTSTDNSFEYFALYEGHSGDFDTISDSLVFNMFETPIEYYLDLGLHLPSLPFVYHDPFPFYEVYFSHPYTVADTFFIGFSRRSAIENYKDPATGITYDYSNRPVEISGIINLNLPDDEQDWLCYMLKPEYCPPYWFNQKRGYLFIYPILAPREIPDDTTHSGGDTTDIAGVQTVARFVSLQPNPASDRVQVVSSIGLKHVDIYNSAGVKVQECSASGVSVTIPLVSLPDDTYLVHIATPSGTVTKKLVVQRR